MEIIFESIINAVISSELIKKQFNICKMSIINPVLLLRI